MATSRAVYPPAHIPSAPTTVYPAAAETLLSQYLSQTPHKAHLHPDALLSSTGIQFSANSGPKGGLALHHLTRIAAGLRGENLVQETQEELEAQFAAELGATVAGDDVRLDDVIEKMSGGGKRSRSLERVREWDDRSAQALGAAVDAELEAEGEDQRTYELKQEILEGDLGDRDGAPVVERNANVPEIQTHDEDGEEERKPAVKKIKTEPNGHAGAAGGMDKASKKAAKKARRDAEKRQRETERKGIKKKED